METTNPIFQTQKHPSLKPTYSFASTKDLIDSLAGTGWYPADMKYAKARKPGKEGYQKHIVRLHNDSFLKIPGLTDDNASRPEIIWVNAHDGSAASRLLCGLFRMACLNGIIAGTSLREFRAIHSGNMAQKLVEGIEYISGGIPALIEAVQKLQNTQFSPEAREVFVKTLVDERLANSNVVPGSVDYEGAAMVRRSEDKANDAFTVFNRVQESIIRGGIRYKTVRQTLDVDGKVVAEEIRNATTRKLNSIPQAVRLNTLAYDLATKLVA